MKKEKNKNAFGLNSRESTMPVVPMSKSQQMAERKAIIAENADPIIRKTIEIALDENAAGRVSQARALPSERRGAPGIS